MYWQYDKVFWFSSHSLEYAKNKTYSGLVELPYRSEVVCSAPRQPSSTGMNLRSQMGKWWVTECTTPQTARCQSTRSVCMLLKYTVSQKMCIIFKSSCLGKSVNSNSLGAARHIHLFGSEQHGSTWSKYKILTSFYTLTLRLKFS